MSRTLRCEFIGGPLDNKILEVLTAPHGGPAGEVYVELTPPSARPALVARPGEPRISPAGFTGPWVTYRLQVNPDNALKPSYVLAEGEVSDWEKGVMKANLSRFLHRRDEA